MRPSAVSSGDSEVVTPTKTANTGEMFRKLKMTANTLQDSSMFQKKTRLVEEDPEARLRPDANVPRSSQVLIINNTAFLAIGEGVPTVRQAAHRDRRPKYIGSAMIPVDGKNSVLRLCPLQLQPRH